MQTSVPPGWREKNILLLGSNGQLGGFLNHFLKTIGNVHSFHYPAIDFMHPTQVCNLIDDYAVDIVINAVAFTDVDRAEDQHQQCEMINAITPAEIASLSARKKFLFVHFSTDFVFDGTKMIPYEESDTPNPINQYGRSKARGDAFIAQNCNQYLIFRTSWLYSKQPSSFVGKVLAWSRTQEQLTIVDDQIGSPTSALDLSQVVTMTLADVLQKKEGFAGELFGLYHLGGTGAASRYTWAENILEFDPHKEEQVFSRLLAAKSDVFDTPAKRPLYTPLNCSKFTQQFQIRLPNWQDSLQFLLQRA